MSTVEPQLPPAKAFYFKRFGLRTLFVIVAICAVLIAFVGRDFYRNYLRDQAVAAIRAAGGAVITRGESIDRVLLKGDKFDDPVFESLAPHLRNLPELKQLDLAQNRMSDASLPALEQIGQVREMRIFETKITPEGIRALKLALPQTKVAVVRPDPVASGLAMRRIYRHAVVTAQFAPDGQRLFIGNGEGELVALETNAGEPVARVSAHKEWLFCVAVRGDGQLLATGGGDNAIRLWDARTLAPFAELRGHEDDVHAVAFSADGRRLFSAGDDRVLRAWDLTTKKPVFEVKAHDGSIPSLAYSPTLNLIATGSRDDTIRLWDADTGRLVRMLVGHQDDVNGVAFSNDGRTVASASYDGTVCVWNADTGDKITTLVAGDCRVHAVRFAPADRIIAAAANDGRVRVWEVASGQLLKSLREQEVPASLAFDRESYLATVATDGSVIAWRRAANDITSFSQVWHTSVIPARYALTE